MKSKIQNPKSKILIVGGAVAGASAAIRLVKSGFRVCLIERERFPRQKLCGEFVSPECLEHFRHLGVLDEMLASGGESLNETVFYAPNGRSVTVPSEWFSTGGAALGISRAEMDFLLLERARNLGVEILEGTQAIGLLEEGGEIRGVTAKSNDGKKAEITADLTIDASGRTAVLANFAKKSKVRQNNEERTANNEPIHNRLVGFKAHLRNSKIERGRCEIYFFPGGYGGLNRVENGLANHCFLIDAKVVRKFGGDADRIVREVVFRNSRASELMENAQAAHDWLAVSVDSFGRKNLTPAPKMLAIGDAGAFIDPFTGSGMLMALESAEIAARAIAENFPDFEKISAIYQNLHQAKFSRRLRVCSILRRAAFVPNLAATAIYALSLSNSARFFLARATRRA
ncbi:MAG: FAD-dependent monooxygenase [Acidobacteriota bacterium]|nr:FAD-dependent monooxygenase [Acidobacteriota bacterium]